MLDVGKMPVNRIIDFDAARLPTFSGVSSKRLQQGRQGVFEVLSARARMAVRHVIGKSGKVAVRRQHQARSGLVKAQGARGPAETFFQRRRRSRVARPQTEAVGHRCADMKPEQRIAGDPGGMVEQGNEIAQRNQPVRLRRHRERQVDAIKQPLQRRWAFACLHHLRQ